MDIRAEEYYDDNLENYSLLNKIDPMTAKQAMEMMEKYHEHKLKLLGIANVVGQSEQLVCYTCNTTKGNAPKGDNFCNMCDHYF